MLVRSNPLAATVNVVEGWVPLAASTPLGSVRICIKAVVGTLRGKLNAQVPVSSDLLAAAAEVVDAWAPLAAHPNLGCPRGAFASGELGGGVALFLAHAFQPCALTLEQVHLLPTSGPCGALVSICKFYFGGVGPGLACTTLWSIAC